MKMQNQSVIVESSAVSTFMPKVYLWMTLALIITGLTAYYVSNNPAIVRMFAGSSLSMIIFFIVMLALVYIISAKTATMPTSLSVTLFTIYSVLMGIMLSTIFLVYTSADIYSAFFITAGSFAVLSIFGMTTKRDLSGLGTFLFIALVGIIIASVVNIFMKSTTVYWVITYAGVLIFAGLTAYDTQKLKNIGAQLYNQPELATRYSISGALALYLDFINMFLFILRIVSSSRR